MTGIVSRIPKPLQTSVKKKHGRCNNFSKLIKSFERNFSDTRFFLFRKENYSYNRENTIIVDL